VRPLSAMIKQISKLLEGYSGDQEKNLQVIQKKLLYMSQLLRDNPGQNRFPRSTGMLDAAERQIQHWIQQLSGPNHRLSVPVAPKRPTGNPTSIGVATDKPQPTNQPISSISPTPSRVTSNVALPGLVSGGITSTTKPSSVKLYPMKEEVVLVPDDLPQSHVQRHSTPSPPQTQSTTTTQFPVRNPLQVFLEKIVHLDQDVKEIGYVLDRFKGGSLGTQLEFQMEANFANLTGNYYDNLFWWGTTGSSSSPYSIIPRPNDIIGTERTSEIINNDIYPEPAAKKQRTGSFSAREEGMEISSADPYFLRARQNDSVCLIVT